MYQDNHSRTKGEHVIEPAAHTSTQTGASIDTLGFESLEYFIHVGAAMVGGGFAVTIEESEVSDFSSGVTLVPTEEILGALPTISIGDTDKVFRVGSSGKKRFQRPVLTESGAISAGVVGVLAVLSHPENCPVADQST